MTGETGGDGSRDAFQVAYVGDDSDDHSMDVDALGPALLGFGKLIRGANAEMNGERASVKVLVASDFEHKCFNINFEVVQVVKEVKDFLDGDGVQNVTELLKNIGVLGGMTIGALNSVLKYLEWRKGRKVQKVEHPQDAPQTVIVKVEGDNNTVTVSNNVYRIASRREVLEAVEATLAPIKDQREANTIEFRKDDKPVEVIERKEAEAIIATCEADIKIAKAEMPNEEDKPRTVTATLYVYGPVFDAKAPNWRFLHRNKPIYADVRQTNIAKDAVKRGGSFVNDRYKVKMEVTPPATPGGDTHYKITAVLEFTPAETQISMALKKPRKKAAKKKRAG